MGLECELWGIDDGINRILVRLLVTARLAVNEQARTVRIYRIEYRR